MKRSVVYVLFCMVALICIGGCSNNKIEVQLPANNATVDLTENSTVSEYFDIYSAYREVLLNIHQTQKSGEAVKYTLYDINKDSVPEIILHVQQWEYMVYTYGGTTPIPVGSVVSKYGLDAFDGNGVYTKNGGTGYLEVLLVPMDGTEFSSNPTLHLMHDIQIDYQKYIIDGKEVSEQEYTAYRESENTVNLDKYMYDVTDWSHLETLK